MNIVYFSYKCSLTTCLKSDICIIPAVAYSVCVSSECEMLDTLWDGLCYTLSVREIRKLYRQK